MNFVLAQQDLQDLPDFSVFGPFIAAYFFVIAIVAILGIIAMWRLFEKAGQPGWWSIIPIWNILVFLDIVGRPRWWILLYFIPFVNFVVGILVYIDLAKSFGKDEIWAVFLIFFSIIALLVLAFGDSQYVGPGGRKDKGYAYEPAY